MGGTDPRQITWKVVYAIEVVDCPAELLQQTLACSHGWFMFCTLVPFC